MSLHNTSLHYTIRLCVLQRCGRGGHRVALDTSQPSVTGGSGTMIAGVCHPAGGGGAFGTDFVFFISCRQNTHNPVKGQEDKMLEKLPIQFLSAKICIWFWQLNQNISVSKNLDSVLAK